MKKIVLALALAVSGVLCFAFGADDIKVFTLQNGLTLCTLQDTTTATVRLELNINAGTVCQNADNAGFFGLYAGIMGLNLSTDCVSTTVTVAPSQTESAIIGFTKYFKDITLTDRELNQAVSKIRAGINEFAYSAAGFINSTIDTKIFPKSPWKQESGVNPEVFNSKNTEQIRTILADIGSTYYTPKNSVLYISGNITSNSALMLAEKYLGVIESKSPVPSSSSIQEYEKFIRTQNFAESGKYVLIDEELSSDITQVVIQYTNFDQDEADLIANVFNRPTSEFKRLLLKQRNLSIRGADYIDASSAQQKTSSRLIIQAICEKTKVSPATQGDLFLMMSRDNETPRISQEEVDGAVSKTRASFNSIIDNSAKLMEQYALFNRTNKKSSRTLFDMAAGGEEHSAADLNKSYLDKKPFLFVLCNTQTYQKYSKEFNKSGYKLLTRKTGPWYKQKLYTKIQSDPKALANVKNGRDDIRNSAQRFIQSNQAQFNSFTLENKIPVVTKQIENSKSFCIALSIDGGELLFAGHNPGLAELLTNALAVNIRRYADKQIESGSIVSNVEVTARTKADSSLLIVTTNVESAIQTLRAVSDAVIFGDISPALADGISYDLRTQWRIKTGAPDFQLICAGAKTIFNKEIAKLFDDKKDRPQKMNYTDIAAAYPLILDSSRFSLVVTGGIDKVPSLEQELNNTFGQLTSVKQTQSIKEKIIPESLPKKTIRTQITHQFFTDISADKAGPRPAVLIPTTDFSDPMVYFLNTPDLNSTDCALFNALLYELGERVQAQCELNQEVKVKPAEASFPYAIFTMTKIKHSNKNDAVYAQCVRELATDLEALLSKNTDGVIELEKDDLLMNMENRWVVRELAKTSDAEGSAELIAQGAGNSIPDLYLRQYQAVSSAKAEDYYLIFMSYFDQAPAFKMLSADTKR